MPLFVDHLDMEPQTADIADDHEGDFWYNTNDQALKVRLASSIIATLATLAGGTFTGDISVPDEAYGSGWNGSLEVPTKNAVYDKIETLTASKYILPVMTPDIAKVATTSGVTSSNVLPMVICPRTGTYLLRFYFKVTAVSGTPSTMYLVAPSGTALSKIAANGSSLTTLFAAGATIATAAKGSTFAAGDYYVADSATFSLTLNDMLCVGTSTTTLFRYGVNNATSATIYANVMLVEQ